MLSGNVNTMTMIVFGFLAIVLLAMFGLYALLNNNNTQSLADSVRTALIQNRDDSARVNSNTLYPLNVSAFEKQVKSTRLQEIRGKRFAGQKYHFYYLLQNGQLVDTADYQKKLANGAVKHVDRAGKPTLIKAVTVDVSVDTNRTRPVSAKDASNGEHEMKANGNTKRYSVTYLVDGGIVKDNDSSAAEAQRLLPKTYQESGKSNVDPGTMVNLTDN